jgi:hypothetical protein
LLSQLELQLQLAPDGTESPRAATVHTCGWDDPTVSAELVPAEEDVDVFEEHPATAHTSEAKTATALATRRRPPSDAGDLSRASRRERTGKRYASSRRAAAKDHRLNRSASSSGWVNGNPHPLGLYIFAEDDDITDQILGMTGSGDAVVPARLSVRPISSTNARNAREPALIATASSRTSSF